MSALRTHRSSAASSSSRIRTARGARRTCHARYRAIPHRPPPRRRSASSTRPAGCRLRDLLPCLREHLAQRPGDLVELVLCGDERRGDLNDGVAAVICPANKAFFEETRRDEVTQEDCALLVVEAGARLLVLDELEGI